jgi:hypothetical protein
MIPISVFDPFSLQKPLGKTRDLSRDCLHADDEEQNKEDEFKSHSICLYQKLVLGLFTILIITILEVNTFFLIKHILTGNVPSSPFQME